MVFVVGRGGVYGVDWGGVDGVDWGCVDYRGGVVSVDWRGVDRGVGHGGVVHRSLMVDGLVMADDVLGRHRWCMVHVSSLARGHQSANSYDLKKYVNINNGHIAPFYEV